MISEKLLDKSNTISFNYDKSGSNTTREEDYKFMLEWNDHIKSLYGVSVEVRKSDVGYIWAVLDHAFDIEPYHSDYRMFTVNKCMDSGLSAAIDFIINEPEHEEL